MAKMIRYRTHEKKPQILYLPQEVEKHVGRLMNFTRDSSNLYEIQEKMSEDKYFKEFENQTFDDISIKANYIKKAGTKHPRAQKLKDDIYVLIGAYEFENLCEMTNLSKKEVKLFRRVENKIAERRNKLEVRVSA